MNDTCTHTFTVGDYVNKYSYGNTDGRGTTTGADEYYYQNANTISLTEIYVFKINYFHYTIDSAIHRIEPNLYLIFRHYFAFLLDERKFGV